MAYIYIDDDGDECVKFENGKWDSFYGYRCENCGTYIKDPAEAMEHENKLPCNNDDSYKTIFWK